MDIIAERVLFEINAAAKSKQRPAICAEFITFSVAAEVVVIV